jgi:hypothetical protein
MMRTTRRVAPLAVGAASVAAAIAGTAVPAAASVPSTFVTPVYGMTCTTGATPAPGGYRGYATCATPAVAKWKVRVDCSWGFTWDSIWIYTSSADGWRTLGPNVSCSWGVNDVTVIEG